MGNKKSKAAKGSAAGTAAPSAPAGGGPAQSPYQSGGGAGGGAGAARRVAPPPKKAKPEPADVLKGVEGCSAEMEEECARVEEGDFTGGVEAPPGSISLTDPAEAARRRVAYLDETVTQQMIKLDALELPKTGDLRAARRGLYKRLNQIGERVEALKKTSVEGPVAPPSPVSEPEVDGDAGDAEAAAGEAAAAEEGGDATAAGEAADDGAADEAAADEAAAPDEAAGEESKDAAE